MSAQSQVYVAIKQGRITRPTMCSICGVECRPEAHHADYLRPLEVAWLCRRCHRWADARRRDRLGLVIDVRSNRPLKYDPRHLGYRRKEPINLTPPDDEDA